MILRNFELLTQTAVKPGLEGRRLQLGGGGLRVNTSFIFSTDKMSLRYLNKVVIVTGGSKGIGRGIVKAFGRKLSLLLILRFL